MPRLVLLFLFIGLSKSETSSFVDGRTIILKEDDVTCFKAIFNITLINLNVEGNGNRIPFDLVSPETKIAGHCAKDGEVDPYLKATIIHENRKKRLKFYFGQKTVTAKKSVQELRWQLKRVLYIETFDNRSAEFESDNSSVIISAPLNQKYVCKDKINVTLSGDGYNDVIVEISPDIDVQPYGPRSNFYLCERTRRRTLRESFENKATVFSGVVLGLCAVGSIVGHSLRRHAIPARKQMYENLGT